MALPANLRLPSHRHGKNVRTSDMIQQAQSDFDWRLVEQLVERDMPAIITRAMTYNINSLLRGYDVTLMMTDELTLDGHRRRQARIQTNLEASKFGKKRKPKIDRRREKWRDRAAREGW